MTTTIRVSKHTRDLLHILARKAGVPMQQILEHALEQYRRQQILHATNVAYGAIKSDQTAWSEIEREQAVWDETLADGLEDA